MSVIAAKSCRWAPLQSRLRVLYPEGTRAGAPPEHSANRRHSGASPFEPRRSHFRRRLCLEVQSLHWPSPPQWPSRPRPFQVPPTSLARRSSSRERFLHEGEDPRWRSRRAPAPARAGPGPRRAARIPRRKHPSTAWRREFSLLLGLERLLSEDEPTLVDGTVLSAHQVDALSGTLTALLAEAQRTAPTATGAAARPRPSCSLGATSSAPTRTRQADGDGAERRGGASRRRTRRRTRSRGRRGRGGGRRGPGPSSAPRPTRTTRTTIEDERGRGVEDEEADAPRPRQEPNAEEEPRDWVEDEDEEQLAEQPEDPNAAKRFWFEHATGAGKTVAALGFVEASQTGGVLILTHRRNLVDQFHGELRDRGYSKRISRPLLQGEDSRQRSGHGRDLPVVRAQRRQDLERLHDRHLRRGPHRARREDERGDPQLDGARSSSA